MEAIKTGLLAGGEPGSGSASMDRRAADPAALADIVFACARYKCEVVAVDEHDAGPRQVLNLGHTVGHAIEAASATRRYRHGEAVGLGLLAALRLSGAGGCGGGRGDARALLSAGRLDPAVEPRGARALGRDKKRTAEDVPSSSFLSPG